MENPGTNPQPTNASTPPPAAAPVAPAKRRVSLFALMAAAAAVGVDFDKIPEDPMGPITLDPSKCPPPPQEDEPGMGN